MKHKWCMVLLWVFALAPLAALAILYGSLPDQVPLHWGLDGAVDRYGSKAELLILPVIAWLMYGLMTAVEHIPRIWNTGVRVTEENRERVYAVLGHLLSTQKLLIMVTFAWITLWCTLSKPLPKWFLPAVLGAMSADMVYWLVRLFRAR